MADINDLGKSISEMSVDELHEFLRNVRSRRREGPKPKEAKVSKTKVSKASKIASSFCVEGLSQEAAQKILEMLGPLVEGMTAEEGLTGESDTLTLTDEESSDDDESSNGPSEGD